jgi:hypothetical protein
MYNIEVLAVIFLCLHVLLGYDAVLLGRQLSDFSKGHSAIFFKA